VLEARVRRHRIVLAAAQGEENKQIAERLGIAPNTASKWGKRFFQEGLAGWLTGTGRAGRGPLPPVVIAEVKAIVCELPAARAVPFAWGASPGPTLDRLVGANGR
jgi:transposase